MGSQFKSGDRVKLHSDWGLPDVGIVAWSTTRQQWLLFPDGYEDRPHSISGMSFPNLEILGHVYDPLTYAFGEMYKARRLAK